MSGIDEVMRTLKVMGTSVQITGQNPALTEVTRPLYIYFNEFWTRSMIHNSLCYENVKQTWFQLWAIDKRN